MLNVLDRRPKSFNFTPHESMETSGETTHLLFQHLSADVASEFLVGLDMKAQAAVVDAALTDKEELTHLLKAMTRPQYLERRFALMYPQDSQRINSIFKKRMPNFKFDLKVVTRLMDLTKLTGLSLADAALSMVGYQTPHDINKVVGAAFVLGFEMDMRRNVKKQTFEEKPYYFQPSLRATLPYLTQAARQNPDLMIALLSDVIPHAPLADLAMQDLELGWSLMTGLPWRVRRYYFFSLIDALSSQSKPDPDFLDRFLTYLWDNWQLDLISTTIKRLDLSKLPRQTWSLDEIKDLMGFNYELYDYSKDPTNSQTCADSWLTIPSLVSPMALASSFVAENAIYIENLRVLMKDFDVVSADSPQVAIHYDEIDLALESEIKREYIDDAGPNIGVVVRSRQEPLREFTKEYLYGDVWEALGELYGVKYETEYYPPTEDEAVRASSLMFLILDVRRHGYRFDYEPGELEKLRDDYGKTAFYRWWSKQGF